MVPLEEVVSTVSVPATVFGVVIRTDGCGVDGKVSQFIQECLLVEDGPDVAIYDHVAQVVQPVGETYKGSEERGRNTLNELGTRNREICLT